MFDAAAGRHATILHLRTGTLPCQASIQGLQAAALLSLNSMAGHCATRA